MFPSGVALESLATGHKKMLYEVRFGKAAATSGPHPDGKMVKKVRGKTAAGVGRAVLGRRTDGQKKTAALRSPAHHRAAVEADRTIGASGIVLLRRRRPLVKIVAAMLVTVQRLLLLLQQLPCPQAKAEGEEVVVAVAAEKARATASSTSSSGSSASSSATVQGIAGGSQGSGHRRVGSNLPDLFLLLLRLGSPPRPRRRWLLPGRLALLRQRRPLLLMQLLGHLLLVLIHHCLRNMDVFHVDLVLVVAGQHLNLLALAHEARRIDPPHELLPTPLGRTGSAADGVAVAKVRRPPDTVAAEHPAGGNRHRRHPRPQGGLSAHADAELDVLQVGRAIRRLRRHIPEVDLHDRARLVREHAVRQLIDAHGRELALEEASHGRKINLVVALGLAPELKFKGLGKDHQSRRNHDTTIFQELLVSVAHRRDYPLAKAPEVQNLGHDDVKLVRDILANLKPRGHHGRQELHQAFFLGYLLGICTQHLTAHLPHQRYGLAQPDVCTLHGSSHPEQSKTSTCIKYTNASAQAFPLLPDRLPKGIGVDLESVNVRQHQEVVRQDGQRRRALGSEGRLHPQRCLHRARALLHHPNREARSHGDEDLQHVAHKDRCFTRQVVNSLLPLRPVMLPTVVLRVRSIRQARPGGVLEVAKPGGPPHGNGIAAASLRDLELDAATHLVEGDLGRAVEIEAAERLWGPQKRHLRVGLVVQADAPPPEVSFVVRRAVAEGVEIPHVECAQPLGSDFRRRCHQLHGLRQVLDLCARGDGLDRRMCRQGSRHEATGQEVRREHLRQHDDMRGVGGEMRHQHLVDDFLVVQALRHRNNRQAELVGLHELGGKAGQARRELQQHGPARGLAARDLQGRENGAEAQDDNKRSRWHAGDSFPVEALPLIVHHATAKELAESLAELMRVIHTTLGVLVQKPAERGVAIGPTAATRVPDKVIRHGWLSPRLRTLCEVLRAVLRWLGSSRSSRCHICGWDLIVGIFQLAPLRIIQKCGRHLCGPRGSPVGLRLRLRRSAGRGCGGNSWGRGGGGRGRR
mmetsp:Transcript_23894/g.67686  ORF Transcript_23894/g.67686 Transcript_23894/m.67686 type:complete len:1031 (+) Transcript_23894:279-3371(+)